VSVSARPCPLHCMRLPAARCPVCSAAHNRRGPGAQGARIGVMRQMIDNSSADPEVMRLFQAALDAMAGAGARIIEDFRIRGNSLGDRDWNGKTNAWCAATATTTAGPCPRPDKCAPRRWWRSQCRHAARTRERACGRCLWAHAFLSPCPTATPIHLTPAGAPSHGSVTRHARAAQVHGVWAGGQVGGPELRRALPLRRRRLPGARGQSVQDCRGACAAAAGLSRSAHVTGMASCACVLPCAGECG